MDPEGERPSPAREWWLLIGTAVVFVLGISLLENLVRREPRPATSGEDTLGLLSPAAPEVRRLDDGGIEIRHDFFRRTTIRLEDEDAERALFECLARRIEETFGDGTEGWDRERIGRETRRILDECMGSQGVSVPVPRLPADPGRDR